MYPFCCFTFYYLIHPPISTEPGVPYNVTVRASTAAGKGEPVSIVVFSVEQGDSDTIEYILRIVMCTICPHVCMLHHV